MELSQAEARAICHSFLSQNEYAVLATVHDTIPHAATVTYVVNDDLSLYIATRRTTQKAKDIAANPKAAIAVGFGPGTTSVQALCAVEEVTESEAEELLVNFLVKKDSYYSVFLKLPGLEFVVYKLVPENMRLLVADPKGAAEVFYTII